MGKPEEERSRHRLEDNIKINLEERDGGWGVDRTDLAQDRDKWWDHVNLVMNLWVP